MLIYYTKFDTYLEIYAYVCIIDGDIFSLGSQDSMTSYTPKDLLLLVLEKLVGHRKLAEGFLLILQHSDNPVLEKSLLSIMIKTLKDVKHTQGLTKLQQTVHVLQHLQKQEHREIDQKEADDLLTQLD